MPDLMKWESASSFIIILSFDDEPFHSWQYAAIHYSCSLAHKQHHFQGSTNRKQTMQPQTVSAFQNTKIKKKII